MHREGTVAAQIITPSPNSAGKEFPLHFEVEERASSVWLVLTVDVINSALLLGVCYFYQPWTAVVTALGQTSCSSQSRV